MSDIKSLKQEISKFEKELKTLQDKKTQIEKQKNLISNNNSYIVQEIDSKKKELLKLSNYNAKVKELEKLNKLKDEDNINIQESNKQEIIKTDKLLSILDSIQTSINSPFHHRFKQNIGNLTTKQKDLKINYIIIKKLEIKEEFLKFHKLEDCQK